MPLNAFIVRPFGVKELVFGNADLHAALAQRFGAGQPGTLVESLEALDAGHWRVRINFDRVDELLVRPALEHLRVQGETAGAVVVAGNIREEMFNRLVTADLVVADLSIHNPNVFYELGVRQAFRDKYTFLIRSELSEYPFDLKTDRYFEYSLIDLVDRRDAVLQQLITALRATLSSYAADSPIFKLLPQLQAEDRARFIAVPEDFREEVERARHHRQREHLNLLALECEGFLWEAEGLRVVGRAQFESNFVDGAKACWEQIVNRYPDDVEANTVLSTIYQRLDDPVRADQALARAARSRDMPAGRLSELRALRGRNLKADWIKQWQREGSTLEQRRHDALVSPLLQLAVDAYHEAFMADLNNAYAGLNALTMLVIQSELAREQPQDWAAIQARRDDAGPALQARRLRVRQLVAALRLAVESESERLYRLALSDPWFVQLDAAVDCIVSDQPEHVAQRYREACHFSPPDAEAAMRRALQVYVDLDIRGRDADPHCEIGTLASNVARAMDQLPPPPPPPETSALRQRILMFAGLRLNPTITVPELPPPVAGDAGARPAGPGFPQTSVEAVREAIAAALKDERTPKDRDDAPGRIVFAMAGAANGGDLLFHEACHAAEIRTRLCLALPRPQYVGQYVAPAGKDWVERFARAYHRADLTPDDERRHAPSLLPISVFADSAEMPRWLQGRPFYNVGRRANLWMLNHALSAARELGPDTEITLLVLADENPGTGGLGGLRQLVRLAAMQGIKVHPIAVPTVAATT